MELTLYSTLNAILWFCIFSSIFLLLMKNNHFVKNFNIWLLIGIAAMCIIRSFVIMEIPGTTILHSYTATSTIIDFLRLRLFTILGYDFTTTSLLATIWVIGYIVCIIRLIINQLKFKKWLKHLPLSTDTLTLSIINRLCKSKPTPLVYQSSQIHTPMIAGFFKPIFLLPNYSFSEEFLENIICHEYSHYQNKDIWAKLIFKILCSFMWWNPLTYLLKADLEHLLELKCDENVISKMTENERSEYFNMLLEVYRMNHCAEKPLSPTSTGLVSARNEKKLVQRFQVGSDVIIPTVRNFSTFRWYHLHAHNEKKLIQRFQIGLDNKNKKTFVFANWIICITFLILWVLSYVLII